MPKSIVISAPSGAGKTSIVNFLINEFSDLEFSVSACSRKKRGHEIHGKDYCFLDIEDFKNKINSGLFLEWEEVYPNQFYGTLLSSVEEIWLRDKCVIFDVDVKGAINIKDKFQNNCLAIFIAPPNIETLQQRLLSRDTETKKNVKIRVAKAGKELELQHKFDHIVINDDFSTACKEVRDLVINFLEK